MGSTKCTQQKVTQGREEQKWIQPRTLDLLRIVSVWCLFSLLAGAIVWKSVLPVRSTESRCAPSRTWYSSVASNCESRIITRLSTLQMSVCVDCPRRGRYCKYTVALVVDCAWRWSFWCSSSPECWMETCFRCTAPVSYALHLPFRSPLLKSSSQLKLCVFCAANPICSSA